MATVRKRTWNNKNGTGQYWQIDYTDSTGRRVITGKFKRKVDAEKKLAKVLTSIEHGTYVNKKKDITFNEAADRYIKYHAELHCKKSTYNNYKGYLKNHLRDSLGRKKLNSIKPLDIRKLMYEKVNQGLSNQTVNHIIKFIGAVFQKMINDEILFRNPAAKVKKLKLNRKKFKILETEQIKLALDTAEEYFPDFYPLLFTAIFTGMRQGELIALTWDKIDWKNKQIIVNCSYNLGEITTPKSEHSVRRIDMSEKLMNVLIEWQKKCPKSDLNLIFPNQAGNYTDPNNLTKRKFYYVLQLAELERIRFHDLRHTYASLLISQNVPIKYIQNQLGHGSIQVTMDTYGHIMPEVNRQAVNALDSIF